MAKECEKVSKMSGEVEVGESYFFTSPDSSLCKNVQMDIIGSNTSNFEFINEQNHINTNCEFLGLCEI